MRNGEKKWGTGIHQADGVKQGPAISRGLFLISLPGPSLREVPVPSGFLSSPPTWATVFPAHALALWLL